MAVGLPALGRRVAGVCPMGRVLWCAGAQLGNIDNLTELENLNEETLLNELLARYRRDVIYTYVGGSCCGNAVVPPPPRCPSNPTVAAAVCLQGRFLWR